MGAFHSPFIIPPGAFAVAIIGGIWSDMHNKRIRADQRMAMLARSISIDDVEKVLSKIREEENLPKDRCAASATPAAPESCSSCGIGLMLFFISLTVILSNHEILCGAAAGLIPLAIGIGFFVDYNLPKRELSRFGLEIEPDQSR